MPHATSNSLADPELLDLQLGDSNAVLRVLREMVDVRLLVNPRFLLIWKDYSLYFTIRGWPK